MFRNLVIFIMLVAMLPLFAVAQDSTGTDRWRLIWDPNTESDMLGYLKFRDTHAMATTVLDDTTMHNDPANRVWDEETGKEVMQYIDTDLTPGVQYYYRLKAVDSTGLESDYSTEVSAAIPALNSIPKQIVRTGGSFPVIDLSVFAYDPDADPGELTYQVTGADQVVFNLVGSVLTITSYPVDWVGTDTLYVKVSDADEFNSFETIIYEATQRVNPPTNPDFRFLN